MRVLTFNLWQLPVLSLASHGVRRARRARRVIAEADADVVVLNEAFNISPAGPLVRWLRGRGYAATPHVGSWSGRGDWASRTGRACWSRSVVGGGVYVLSRLPVLEQHELVFGSAHQDTQDRLAAKGCALVRIGHPDGPVWVVATHLQADEPPTAPDETHAVRLDQLGEISRLVRSVAVAGEPVVLAGDLNVEYADVERLRSAAAAVGGSLGPTGELHGATYDGGRNAFAARDSPGASKVIDYIGWIDEDGTRPAPRIVTETIGYAAGQEASDHNPVLGHVTVA